MTTVWLGSARSSIPALGGCGGAAWPRVLTLLAIVVVMVATVMRAER